MANTFKPIRALPPSASRVAKILLLVLGAFAFGGLGLAQSDKRVDLPLAGDWPAPATEDLAAYLAALGVPKDADDRKEKSVKRRKDIAAARDRLASSLTKAAERALVQERLATLLREEADALHAHELATDDAEPNHKESRGLMQEAVDNYRALLESYPKFGNRDQAVLQLGLLLSRMGSPSAMPTLEPLLASGAKGKLVRVSGRAHLVAGDVLQRDGKLDAARVQFKKAAKAKDKVAKVYARYRLAWLPMAGVPPKERGEKMKGTAEALRAVATKSCKADRKVVEGRLDLCVEIRKDLVYLLAETEQDDVAKSFFKGRDDSEGYYLVLERLAGRMIRTNRPAQAAGALEKIVKAAPQREGNVGVHAALADAWQRAGRPGDVCEAMKSMTEAYAGGDSPWRQANSEKQKLLKSARETTRVKTVGYAEQYAALSAKGEASAPRGSLPAANCLYGLYVGTFPKESGILAVRFAYGETLARAQRPQDAAEQYLEVAKNETDNLKLRDTAAERMLPLQRNVALALKRPAADQLGKLPEKDFSKTNDLYVRIVDRYVELFQDKTEIPALRLEAATILLDHGKYKDGVRRLDVVTKKHVKAPEATLAVRTVVAVFYARADWQEVVDWSREFLGRQGLGDQTLTTHLRDSWRNGRWNMAEAYVAKGKKPEGAKTYQVFQIEFPKDKDADLALWHASGLYLDLGRGRDGIKPCETLADSYRQSSRRAECLYVAAGVYENLLSFESAARTMARFADDYPQDARASLAMVRSAELYADALNKDMAAVKLAEVARRWPKSASAVQAALRIAELHESGLDFKKAAEAYERFASGPGADKPDDALYALAKAAILTAANIDAKVGSTKLDQIEQRLKVAASGTGSRARKLVAAARLGDVLRGVEAAQQWNIAYESIPVFEKSRAKLMSDLQAGVEACDRLAGIGDAEHVVAAHYLAGVYQEAALKAFKPAGDAEELTPDGKAQVFAARETFLADAQKKTTARFEEALDTAKKYQRHDQWRRLTQKKLARLAPGKYGEAGEQMLRPTFTSHKISRIGVDLAH